MATPNTFTGANMSFPNLGIHFMLAELIKFRKQLTVRQEFKSQSGWNDSLNWYMVTELEKLADTLENITYNPDLKTVAELSKEAADTTRALKDDYNSKALASDNILMPTGIDRKVEWDLTGADLDIPTLDAVKYPNDFGRAFITGLDRVFVELTRLDSRFQPNSISKYESAMIRNLLTDLYTICMRKGAEVNKSVIPVGTLPSQNVNTFNVAGTAAKTS